MYVYSSVINNGIPLSLLIFYAIFEMESGKSLRNYKCVKKEGAC